MIDEAKQIEALENAAREPVSALSAVEVDTPHRAETISRRLSRAIGGRPHAVIPILYDQSPAMLADQAKQEISGWPEDEGVLFVVDQAEADETAIHRFWKEANFLRETLGNLKCHLIFLLLPAGYRALIRDADHLADWIPLKFHILGVSKDAAARPASIPEQPFSSDGLSHKAARQTLTGLQEELSAAIHRGEAKPLLVRRYYLPMFTAAMKINDLRRAQSLRRHIAEEDIRESELPDWLNENCMLDLYLRNLDDAEKSAKRLLDWAKGKNDSGWEAEAYHKLGVTAQERRDFEAAEKRYRKSLEISEKHGNEHGAAGAYHQLGRIAQERRDFEAAEKWYRKSLEIDEKHGNEHGAAGAYHQLGIIAQERRDFEAAEKWYRKALEISEKHGNEHGAASTYGQLGILARLQGHFGESGKWLIKCILGFDKCNDPAVVQQTVRNFKRSYDQAGPETREKLKAMWEAGGLGALSEPGFTGLKDEPGFGKPVNGSGKSWLIR